MINIKMKELIISVIICICGRVLTIEEYINPGMYITQPPL